MRKTQWDGVVLDGLLTQVREVPDPRIRRKSRHLLTDILVISICGVLSESPIKARGRGPWHTETVS